MPDQPTPAPRRPSPQLRSVVDYTGCWLTQAILSDDVSDRMALLFYDDDTVRFRHVCKGGDGRLVVTAPLLASHTVTGAHKVEPSIDCPGCGLHGFVQDGRWVGA